MKKYKGFTLIEVLIVIGILAILSAIVIIAINPGQQFAQARNTQRRSDVQAVLNAVNQNMVKNRGVWTCTVNGGHNLPGTASSTGRLMSDGVGNYNICSWRVDTYIAAMPIDPSTGTNPTTPPCTAYNSGYLISEDSTNHRITVSAPDAELTETITVTR